MKNSRCLYLAIATGIMALGIAVSPFAPAGVVRAETNEEAVTQTATEASDANTSESAAEEDQLTEAERAAKEKEEARLALQNDPNHKHTFKWIAKMNDSESAEGTNNYMCVECGKIWFFRPIAPFYAFQGDIAHRIETAAEGEQVRVKTSHFITFTTPVMTALAERPDVSIYVSFLDQEYKGNRVSFVIPAGEDTLSLLDKNGYAGFLFLGGKYGLTMEEPMIVAEPAEEAEDAEKVEKTAVN